MATEPREYYERKMHSDSALKVLIAIRWNLRGTFFEDFWATFLSLSVVD